MGLMHGAGERILVVKDEAARMRVFSGVVRFLRKPFDMATLGRELRSVLSD